MELERFLTKFGNKVLKDIQKDMKKEEVVNEMSVKVAETLVPLMMEKLTMLLIVKFKERIAWLLRHMKGFKEELKEMLRKKK